MAGNAPRLLTENRALSAANVRERRRPLPPEFYARDTELVARDLLGCILESRTREGLVSGRIVETEAYIGEHDLACHAAAGRTRRTEPLYGPPGTSYVYFIYGVHWCFNAVTRAEGFPSAVLVRALEPLSGIALARGRRVAAKRDADLMNGPGKLCEALGINAAHNALPLQKPPLRIFAGAGVPDANVTVTPRIGISESKDWLLRFFVSDNPFVSRTPSDFPRHSIKENPGVGNGPTPGPQRREVASDPSRKRMGRR